MWTGNAVGTAEERTGHEDLTGVALQDEHAWTASRFSAAVVSSADACSVSRRISRR